VNDSTRRTLGHAVAGAGLGLCVGVLVGLTTSPVVGTVIGALAALFATIFGGQSALPGGGAQNPPDTSAFARIGAFGALCTVGVLVGITIRAHNLLGETTVAEVNALQQAGFSKPVALQMVMYRTFGLVLKEGDQLQPAEKGPPPNVNQSSLSAGPAASECRHYGTDQYRDEPAAIVSSWQKAGGDWAAVADAVRGMPPDKQLAVAKAAWSLACAER